MDLIPFKHINTERMLMPGDASLVGGNPPITGVASPGVSFALGLYSTLFSFCTEKSDMFLLSV